MFEWIQCSFSSLFDLKSLHIWKIQFWIKYVLHVIVGILYLQIILVNVKTTMKLSLNVILFELRKTNNISLTKSRIRYSHFEWLSFWFTYLQTQKDAGCICVIIKLTLKRHSSKVSSYAQFSLGWSISNEFANIS